MSHFFDATTGVPLLTCPLQVGQKKTVGLFGGDFSGNDLGVFIDQRVVKIQEKKRQTNFRYFDLTGLQTGQSVLHAFAGLYDYALPIPVTITKKMFTPQGKLTQRQAVINEARSHVGKAHYLWGTAGNTPGLGDGAKYKPKVALMQADSFNPGDPSVLTAFTTVDGLNTCAGSSNNFPQRSALETSAYVLAGLALPIANLTPRTYKFNGLTKPIGSSGNGIVWGEVCTGKKHFDCIGFVNYCYDRNVVAGRYPFGTSIVELMTNSANYSLMEVSDPKDVLNGDIIGQYTTAAGWHHIGMVYLEGNATKVVQAADSPIGITDTEVYNPSSPGAWTKRVRMLDSML